MLKNIVFDMGGVLIRWDPVGFARELELSGEDTSTLLKATYQNFLWGEMDWGRANEQDVYASACQMLPERLHPFAEKLIFHWCDRLQPIRGMADLVHACKRAGKNVYLLSNASHKQKEYWPQIPASEIFDGRVVSAEAGCAKPHAGIFHALLQSYDIKPEESVFIDDMWQNVLGAMQCGFHGVVFDGDTERLGKILTLMDGAFH